MRCSASLGFLAFAAAAAATTCDCGYSVNETTSDSYTIFTDLFETDFLHLYNIPQSIDDTTSTTDKPIGWQPQAYNITPREARGPFGKSAELDNVVANPLGNKWDWGGQGLLGGDPGLQVWVRGKNNLSDIDGVDANDGQMVRIGEIAAMRDDMVYGSFRIAMRLTTVPGTCSAFFWYRNNTQEIDLEYLSSQAPPLDSTNTSAPLNLVLQSPESAALGYNAAPTPGFKLFPLPFLPSAGYHEYRFDWLADRIDFYVDGIYIYTFTDNIPDAPGRLILNHWSNGDQGWSHGPPATDAVTTVSYVKAYFNSSNVTRSAQWSGACKDNWEGRTCAIPEIESGSIDPTGPSGNVTGKTYFFSLQQNADATVNQTIYPGATAVPGLAGRLKPMVDLSELAGLLGLSLVFGVAYLML